MTKELHGTITIYYTDGGLGVIPASDHPIEAIHDREFFLLLEGGYATAPDENGIRIRLPEQNKGNVAILITEKVNRNGSLGEISRTEYK